MKHEQALEYARELIGRESVTPEDGGCQDWIESLLKPEGFVRTRVDVNGVTNSLFERAGTRPGRLAFVGHTDVVPPGPLSGWPHPPFAAQVENGILHGRGAQDMKGAIACWLAAVKHLLREGVELPTIQLLITSDEEGESVDGTIRLVERMRSEDRLPDAAIVGEPSSSLQVGDVIRVGRRGVVQVSGLIEGKQGHSAYPEDADNAVHRAIPALARLIAIDWGRPAEGFPPTTCQITNLSAGTGALNVVPGSCSFSVDIRYNPGIDFEAIQARLFEAFDGVQAVLDIQHQAEAFVTPPCAFLDLVEASIQRIAGITCRRDTGGGTSDGRFLSAAGVPLAELGLTNSTIHQVGECVAVDELDRLTEIYADIIANFEVHA